MKFNVPTLRPIYAQDERRSQSTWKKFTGGVFDTMVEEIPDDECEHIRRALEKCAKVGANITFTIPEEILHVGKEPAHGIR
jgi:hypothetical protein